MNKDFEIIKNDLYDLGIKKGDDILFHSSFRSLGGVEGGIAVTVHQAVFVDSTDVGIEPVSTLDVGKAAVGIGVDLREVGETLLDRSTAGCRRMLSDGCNLLGSCYLVS